VQYTTVGISYKELLLRSYTSVMFLVIFLLVLIVGLKKIKFLRKLKKAVNV